MIKQLIQTLQLIVNDAAQNYKDFNQNKLREAVSQFQKKVLSSRKKDIEIKSNLENFTAKQILKLCNKLDLNLLSPPKQKNKLIPLINSLILQTGKKKEFLEGIKTIKTSIKIPTSKVTKKMAAPSISEYENLRKLWLTNRNLNQLENELLNVNMNTIRAVVKPWGVKPSGRTKDALISAVINYITRMRRFSKLGT